MSRTILINVKAHNGNILDHAQNLLDAMKVEQETGTLTMEGFREYERRIKNCVKTVKINLAELEKQQAGGTLQ